ncbi:ATP-dependent DNA helicase RecG [Nakamurella flava]|uniref:Probable DNA 3'-5' helicase RecG n=1 Tax=Nakamurella flava TaxID=2576308 RepID=A0A4U6QLL4_9ACTN|nr:ATP-dependent DNA helicase RecG [Nakamurella flava]TKV61179.1 ATP-dependent DNA helicase RecG [Nakamurella flava]
MNATLQTPLREAVGGRTAARLTESLGVVTLGQMLAHYPRRYDQRGQLTDIAGLVVGERATVLARVVDIQEIQPRGGGAPPRGRGRGGVSHITRITVADGKGRRLTCTFFNQRGWKHRLPVGTEAMFSGKVSEFRGERQISTPSVAVIGRSDEATPDGADGRGAGSDAVTEAIEEFAGGLAPVYPLAEGVTQQLLQKVVKLALDLVPDPPDPLPELLVAGRELVDLGTALRDIHRPRSKDALTAAQERLRYDEALAIQLVLAQRRARARHDPAEPCPPIEGGLLSAFDAALPFALTDGQQQVGEQIARDLSTLHPMNRLLQGEVGSGKTVVALRAMLQVLDAGRQAVLLAPTEVLAGQHVRSLRAMLGPLGRGGELGAPPEAIAVTLLTGSLSTRARREALSALMVGQPGIVVGTHALLSEGVVVSNLGLVVVDEQHRFGVEQRDALRGRQVGAAPPHVLVMTATPIPRTVAMTVYGDLDTSTLEGLPRGRSPIKTTVVPAAEKPAWLERAWDRVREEVGKGHQIYVVCPKIGDDETDPEEDGGGSGRSAGKARRARRKDADDEWGSAPDDDGDERRPPLSVVQVAEHLGSGPLAGLRLEILHGRLPAVDKERTMLRFAAGEIDVLVSTTVIEVGVDVPNATMMVIMDAERFGLSQLHQLRGRVGRGTAEGVCLLVSEAPPGSAGRERLDAIAATTDGFRLAEIDLEMRREGNVLGTHQAGAATSLKMLRLLRDRSVIEQARIDAQDLVADDPELTRRPALAEWVATTIAAADQEYLEKG